MRRIAQARGRRQPGDGREVSTPPPQGSLPDLAQLTAQPDCRLWFTKRLMGHPGSENVLLAATQDTVTLFPCVGVNSLAPEMELDRVLSMPSSK
jgi:hypothetical protein